MDARRMCPHCRAFITNKDRVCPYCNETVGPRAAERREGPSILGGFIPHARFNTILILVVNFGLFIVTTVFSMKIGQGSAMNIDMGTLAAFGGKDAYRIVAYGQWWRLITAGFLHGGLLHILMNSWVLFDLGAQVEDIYGASRMWVIYLVSSIAGFCLSAVVNPQSLSIGASAAICGLLGAMIALGVRHRNPVGAAIRGMYIRWAVYILIFSLLPGVDMAAHVGGIIAGFAIAYVAGQPRYEGSPVERIWRVAAWLGVIVTVVAFLKMYMALPAGLL